MNNTRRLAKPPMASAETQQITPDQVSCVIPYGGAATYIEETVASAANQRFAEIIIVNDGRAPDQLNTVAKVAGVRMIHLASPGGPSKARNIGIVACKTPYVALLDGDDIFCQGYIEEIAAWMVKNQLRCAGATLRYIGERSQDSGSLVSRSQDFVLPSGFIARVDLLAEVGYFPESLSEDDLLCRAIRKVTRLTVCPSAYVLYRIHVNSASSTRAKAQWAFGRLTPLYESGELTLEQANQMANTFASDGTIPPGMDLLFAGSRMADFRSLSRSAYACWLNHDFTRMVKFGLRLLPYLPELARAGRAKWGRPAL